MSVVPEGAGLAQGLRFGEVAELYERRRPGYPDALIADVLGSVGPPRTVLEVGAGTGKATRLLAAAGARVTAVEPDPAMAAHLRANLPAGVTVEDGTLDAVAARRPEAPGGGGFALVVAAQAWHWVDQQAGPRLAHGLLRPGGVLAVFWNTPLDGPDYEAMTDVYRTHAPDMAEGMATAAWAAEMAARLASLQAAEGFEPPETRTYDWEATYDPEALSELVQTYSGHRLLDPPHLAALSSAVGDMVAARGATVTLGYRTVCYLMRRR